MFFSLSCLIVFYWLRLTYQSPMHEILLHSLPTSKIQPRSYPCPAASFLSSPSMPNLPNPPHPPSRQSTSPLPPKAPFATESKEPPPLRAISSLQQAQTEEDQAAMDAKNRKTCDQISPTHPRGRTPPLPKRRPPATSTQTFASHTTAGASFTIYKPRWEVIWHRSDRERWTWRKGDPRYAQEYHPSSNAAKALPIDPDTVTARIKAPIPLRVNTAPFSILAQYADAGDTSTPRSRAWISTPNS